MLNERLLKVILSPLLSEKSNNVADASNQHVFKVLRTATKPEIKKAIEKLFDVKVINVTTVSMPACTRRFGGHLGKTKAWKKAYVRLADGNDIKFA